MTAQVRSVDSTIINPEEPKITSPLLELGKGVRYELLGRKFVTRSEIWRFMKPAMESVLRRAVKDGAKAFEFVSAYEREVFGMVLGITADYVSVITPSLLPAVDSIYVVTNYLEGETIDWTRDEAYAVRLICSEGNTYQTYVVELIDGLPLGYELADTDEATRFSFEHYISRPLAS